MRHFASLLCFLTALLVPALASAAEVTIGDLTYTADVENTYVSVKAANTDITTADIRSSVEIDGTTLPVTSIGYHAFRDCLSLTSVSIPEGATSIGGYAFYDCRSLTEVISRPTTPPALGSDNFPAVRTVYVPAESVDAYTAADGWKDLKIVALVPVTGISLEDSELTLKVGDTHQFTATIAPEDATDKAVTWTSSNPEVASIDANGLLTIIAEGDPVTVTATSASNPEIKATAKVTIQRTTAIEEISATPAANAPIYNLQGVKIGTSTRNLAPGIYIINGKKHRVK